MPAVLHSQNFKRIYTIYIKFKRIDAVIRSGKVTGDNVNISANTAVTPALTSNYFFIKSLKVVISKNLFDI